MEAGRENGADPEAALAALHRQIAACDACELARSANRAVPGEGSARARIMFIGEAPGYYEDQQGRPFVGPAGQFLDQLLESIGLKRSDVFIGNVVKHRPPGNRDPLPGEIAACAPWLERQTEIIAPQVIVTLGRYSMNRFFPGASIGKVHGQARRVGNVLVVPMYHPAAALHQGTLRRVIEADFRKLSEYLRAALQEDGAGKDAEPQPEQMRLL